VWQQEVRWAPWPQVVGGELWLYGRRGEEERSRQTQYVLMGMLAEVLRSELYSRKYAHENVGWSITHRIILSKICSWECRQGYYAQNFLSKICSWECWHVFYTELYSRKYAHENVGRVITLRIILSKICSWECWHVFYTELYSRKYAHRNAGRVITHINILSHICL